MSETSTNIPVDPEAITTRAQAEAFVRATPRRCRGPLAGDAAAVTAALLRDHRLEEAAHEDRAGRAACGADFNDVICAGPFDGLPHPYTCPRCGLTGEYTAPRFPLVE